MWDGEKVIYTSQLLAQPSLTLPPGLLTPGGYYNWRIHARDRNEDVYYGDFNHGSLSEPFEFTVAE
ncbi:MAG: hypothetical protein OEZ43_10790 [Gammaproteobacteria bacterium]|nr:hypothetical protein [Gammaproteobacteria bacterium]